MTDTGWPQTWKACNSELGKLGELSGNSV